MYENLGAIRNWWKNADARVFWFGLFAGIIVVLSIQAALPLKAEDDISQIAADGMQVAGEMVSAGFEYLGNQYVPKQSFDDVPPDHWAYAEIELIRSYGITAGCSLGPLYCPDRSPTRAEMAVFAARLLEIIKLETE